MEKKEEKYFNEKFITIFICISILIFPILELIGIIFNKKFFMQEEALSVIGIFGVFVTIYYIFKCIKAKKIVLSDIFILLSILFCVFSIIFSKNIKTSIMGHKGYSETPLQVMGYFTLFLLCTNIWNERNKKVILNTFFILGIIEATVAFFQNFGIWPVTSMFDPNWHTREHLAFGFTQHCNFFAAIAIIFTALFSTKFIYSNTKKEEIYLYFGTILCECSVLFTCTRLGWVGIITIVFSIIILDIILKKKIKRNTRYKVKVILLLISLVICMLLVSKISGQLEKDILNSKEELNSDFQNFGTKRGKIWKAGFEALKQYPITGVGFDIYDYSFLICPDQSIRMRQNKGHNEYLHITVTQGIFSGINYLAFCFYTCFFAFNKIKKSDTEFGKSDLTKIFLVALCAYYVQALFNSSVTNVAIYKWILMGLLLPKNEQQKIYFFNLLHKKYKKV